MPFLRVGVKVRELHLFLWSCIQVSALRYAAFGPPALSGGRAEPWRENCCKASAFCKSLLVWASSSIFCTLTHIRTYFIYILYILYVCFLVCNICLLYFHIHRNALETKETEPQWWCAMSCAEHLWVNPGDCSESNVGGYWYDRGGLRCEHWGFHVFLWLALDRPYAQWFHTQMLTRSLYSHTSDTVRCSFTIVPHIQGGCCWCS